MKHFHRLFSGVPFVLELVAIGPESDQRWRRKLPDEQPVRLGRAPADGWDVAWDLRVSREHADLLAMGDRLKVRCLGSARNSAILDGQSTREFTIDIGQKFQIGHTTFYLDRPDKGASAAASSESDDADGDKVNKLRAGLQSLRDRLSADEGKTTAVPRESREAAMAKADLIRLNDQVETLKSGVAEREEEIATLRDLERQSAQKLSLERQMREQADEQLAALERQLADSTTLQKERDELQTRLDELQQQFDELQQQLEQQGETENDANSLIQQWEQQAADSQSRLDASEQLVRQLEAQRGAISDELALAQAELEKMQAERDAAHSERDAAQSELESVQSELVSAQTERDSAQADLGSAREETARVNGELDEATARLQSQTDELGEANAARSQLVAEAESLQETIAELTREKDEIGKEVAGFQAELQTALAQTAELDGHAARVTELEAAHEEQTAEMAELQAKFDEQTGQNQELEAARSELAERVSELTERVTAKGQRIDDLEATEAELRAQAGRLEEELHEQRAQSEQLAESQSRVEELVATGRTSSARIEELEADAREFVGRLEELQSQLQQQTDRASAADRQNGQLAQDLQSAQTKNDELSARLASLEQDRAAAEQQLSESSDVKSQVDELRQALAAAERTRDDAVKQSTELAAELRRAHKAEKKATQQFQTEVENAAQLQREIANAQNALQEKSSDHRELEAEVVRLTQALAEAHQAAASGRGADRPSSRVTEAVPRKAASTEFDPYHRWLGIPPSEQPADHYRLLGLARFEENADVIEDAADRQMAHIRRYQSGKNSKYSQRLLNELSSARVCLLDPGKKSEYDSQLWSDLEMQNAESEESGEFDGSVLGDYLLLDLLGGGPTGSVFMVEQRTLGRVEALKILSDKATKSPELVARFRRKVGILAKLSHPNLVAAYDAGVRDGMHYLSMEFVDGSDLIELMKKFNPLPVEAVLDYILQAAEGLAYLHSHGIYHRNVKPGHLLVDQDGMVKVIGLGLAYFSADAALASHDSDLVESGKVVGTVDFLAPEQSIDSSTIDHRADIYSLGCTLFTALTRRLLFPLKTLEEKIAAHRQHPIPSIRQFRPDVPATIELLVNRMVAKRPEDRVQSMQEVVAALQVEHAFEAAPAAPLSVPVAQAADTIHDGDALPGFLTQIPEQEQHWKKKGKRSS